MQTFSKFALIYVSIDQLARYFMGGFVIFFFSLVFSLLLVNIYLSLSCFFFCFFLSVCTDFPLD